MNFGERTDDKTKTVYNKKKNLPIIDVIELTLLSEWGDF